MCTRGARADDIQRSPVRPNSTSFPFSPHDSGAYVRCRTSYIHSFVRAAILMSVFKYQRKRQRSVSKQDVDDPPAYPRGVNPPSYSNIDPSLHQADGRPACKDGGENAVAGSSVAGSSETLTELITLPDIPNDDDEDGNETRPLLGI